MILLIYAKSLQVYQGFLMSMNLPYEEYKSPFQKLKFVKIEIGNVLLTD